MPTESPAQQPASLLLRIHDLERQLQEAEDALGAIRRGEVDAFVVSPQAGETQVYTLESVDQPYRLLIEQMQEGALTLRGDGTIMYCNSRAAGILGVPQGQLIGQRLQQYMPPRDAGYFDQFLISALNAQERFELNLRAGDGTLIPVSFFLNVLRTTEPPLLCGVLTDLTVQKRHIQALAEATDALARTTQALKRSNIELDGFASVASDDLKEPLRGTDNFAAFLQRSAESTLTEQEIGRVKIIIGLTRRMDGLGDALLRYARVSRTEFALETIDLNELLRDALEPLQHRLDDVGVEIRVPQPLPVIHTDRIWLAEVFSTLIGNAIKYSDRAAGDRWIEIGWGRDGEHLVFSVRDNGIGIARQNLEEVFGIFRRLHDRDEYAGGNGAGLTIARGIIERLGGHLWAESAGPGNGSTFFFSMGRPLAHINKP